MELTIKHNKGNYKLPILSFTNKFLDVGNCLLEIFSNNKSLVKDLGFSILISLELEDNIEITKISRYKSLKNIDPSKNLSDLVIFWIQTTILSFKPPLKPFWDDKCHEVSPFLPYIEKKESIQTRNSSFSFKTNQSLIFVDNPNYQEKTVLRTRKIRIYPDLEQKEILKGWMGTASYVYNKVLASIKDGKEENTSEFALNKKYTGISPLVEEWERETPHHIRQIAIGDLVTARKAAFTNFFRGNISGFNMKFRSKKKGTRSIGIPKKSISIKNKLLFVYSKKINQGIRICKKKNLPEIDNECRIKEEDGRWYVLIPISIPYESFSSNKTCSLDPGIRKFQTIYSTDEILKIETKRNYLKKLYDKISLLQSLRDRKIIKNRYYRRKTSKLYFRLSNLIDDMQYQLINHLTRNYSTILIPTFESQKMSQTLGGRRNRRDLLNLKHYRFKQRLKDKAIIRGAKVIDCTEEYTSKTCGNCGCLREKLGGAEIFDCKNCGFMIDRDINGARNIMIKAIKEGLIPLPV